MKSLILFISIQIIYLIYSKTIYPSDEIWQNVKIYARQGLMLYNKNYFIYDEKNYTQLDIHGEKMLELNKKQYEAYINNNLSNYIFIVECVDEDKIKDIADELSLKIKREINYDHNYILALFSMKNHKVQFYAGQKAHKIITSENHKQILNDIRIYMRNKQYYNAWNKIIDDYNYYNKTYFFFQEPYSTILAILIIICFYFLCRCYGINCSNRGYNSYSYYKSSFGGRNSVASGGGGGNW